MRAPLARPADWSASRPGILHAPGVPADAGRADADRSLGRRARPPSPRRHFAGAGRGGPGAARRRTRGAHPVLRGVRAARITGKRSSSRRFASASRPGPRPGTASTRIDSRRWRRPAATWPASPLACLTGCLRAVTGARCRTQPDCRKAVRCCPCSGGSPAGTGRRGTWPWTRMTGGGSRSSPAACRSTPRRCCARAARGSARRRAAAVNHRGRPGERAFLVCRDPQRLDADVAKLVDPRTARMERIPSSPVDAFDVLSVEDSWTRMTSGPEWGRFGTVRRDGARGASPLRPAVRWAGAFVAPMRGQTT